MKKKINKEERKDNLNEPLVIIEQDSILTRKRVISYPFNKEKRGRTFEEKNSNRAGPGSYNVEKGINLTQNVVSKNPRFANSDNGIPGVGEYEIKESTLKVETSAPKYGIPKAQRKNPFEVNKEKIRVPGIGSYNVSTEKRKHFYRQKS